MALYEYQCAACGTKTEKRVPISEMTTSIDCPKCGKRAEKLLGSFAVVGLASAGIGDGPAPWDDGGMGGDFGGGMDDFGMDDF